MTMMPQWKRCPRCGKLYDWNPDVGVMKCPYCMEKDLKRVEKLKGIFGKKSSDKKDSDE